MQVVEVGKHHKKGAHAKQLAATITSGSESNVFFIRSAFREDGDDGLTANSEEPYSTRWR